MNVKLISKTVGVGEFKDKSIEDMIVHNARVSSNRDDKFENPEGLLSYCIKNGHWSIFEQGNLGIEIITSRAISQQMIRHKSFCFQEFSQRYSAATEFELIELRSANKSNRQSSSEVIDPIIYYDREHPEVLASKVINKTLSDVVDLYRELLYKGVAPETARMILPLCTQTKLYVNGNIRSWITYLEQRLSDHTQKEHRLIAQEIWNILKEECPIISNMLIKHKPEIFK